MNLFETYLKEFIESQFIKKEAVGSQRPAGCPQPALDNVFILLVFAKLCVRVKISRILDPVNNQYAGVRIMRRIECDYTGRLVLIKM